MGSRRAALAPFRHAWPHLWRHRRGLLIGAACLLPSVGLDLLIPWIWKQGLDGAIERTASAERLIAVGAGGVLLGLLSGLLKYAMRRALVGASRDFERDLRLALHRKLLDLPARWFSGSTVGDLTSRLSQDVEAVRMALGPGSMYVLSAVVTVFASFAAMLAVDPWMTLWLVAPLLLLGGAALWIAPRLGKASDEVQQAIGKISSASAESFAGVRVLKAFCGEERQLSRMQQLSRRYFDAQLALARARGGMMALLFLVKDASLFVILLVGGLSIGAGHATVGDLILFRDWLLACFWPLVTFGWIVSMVQRAAAGMRRIGDVFEAAPLPLPAAPRALPETGPLALEWDGVTVEIEGRRLLDAVSLAVPAGGSLGITGRTGAGKSLLLQLVPRLFDPDGGTVRVGGIDVRELDPDALRRRIANVPQEAFLFAETLRDNLAFGRHDVDREAVEAAVRQAGLTDEVARFPEGLATRLGERGVTLSGGQRQRATLARALLRGGALLLIDDGFSAIDAHTEATILASLRAASAGATTVVVSHRVAALKGLDRVAVIEEGRLVEHGPPAELLARNGAYARLARDQQLLEELEAL